VSWETRKGSGRYYTRSFRRNGRMVREYVGGGLTGELAARNDELKREKRRQEREAREKERAELAAVSQVLAALAALSEAQMREGLEARGYHYHKGEWRKRRPQRGEGHE
jgi:hypothetical protein